MPVTSIYTRSDGVVAWKACLEPEGTQSENVEVRSTHLGLGFHPKGFGHPHIYSDIDAFTLGAVRDLPLAPGRLGVGADVTVYRMSPDMALYYDGSKSFHLFLRWRPRAAATAHLH